MMRRNLFDGDSYYALFSQVSYKLLISRKWVTYADIMACYIGLSATEDLPCNISNCDNYGELKKAFRDIRKIINDKFGCDCFEEEGNNRNKRFRYVGDDNDPLADMRNARVVKDLKKYWKFCQDSAGFFPKSWLEYYFKDCQDLLDIKSKKLKGEQMISSSIDRILVNIDYLPMLYEAIVNKQRLKIDYKPFDEECCTLSFHPHHLKEHNGRWFLFGHAEGREPYYGYNLAIDRIQAAPCLMHTENFISAPANFYNLMFKDIVGVSHLPEAKVENIIIRVHTNYIYKLAETKPMHGSFRIVKPFGEYEDGTYGEFSVQVEVNNEFIGRVLQMGAGYEIVSPANVRKIFCERVMQLAALYDNKK